MALRSVKPQPQLALDETVVEDPDLEQALEERYTAKVDAAAATKLYQAAAEVAGGLIEALGLHDDTPVRVGRFRITKRSTAARSVAFDTQAGSRITISLVDGD